VGLALLLLAPVAFVGTYLGLVAAVGLATAGVVALCTLPDVDMRLPLVDHRGITHTVLAAAVVGLALGGAAWRIAVGAAPASPPGPAAFAFGFGVGAFAVLAHIAGDVLTPMGVRPFRPFSDARYSLGLVRAANRPANGAALLLGGAAWVGAVVTGLLARGGTLPVGVV